MYCTKSNRCYYEQAFKTVFSKMLHWLDTFYCIYMPYYKHNEFKTKSTDVVNDETLFIALNAKIK